MIDHEHTAALAGEKPLGPSESTEDKPTLSRAQSEYDTLPRLSAVQPVPFIAGATVEDEPGAALESQTGETGLPPDLSKARMVVLATAMMMTYFVGVGPGIESD